MLYTHTQKNSGHTPRKLRLLVDMIKKMEPDQAIETLKFTNKLAAPDLAKVIKTAIANAGKIDNLRFAKIEINEGMKMRRIAGTGGRGRPRYIKRRLSHIKIVLTDEQQKGESNGTKD